MGKKDFRFGERPFDVGLFLRSIFMMNIVVALIAGYFFLSIEGCSSAAPHEPANGFTAVLEFPDPEIDEESTVYPVEEPPVISEENIPAPKKVDRIEYRLEYRFSGTRYTTCYTGYDPGDPCTGNYANQKFAGRIHRHERFIRYEHNTVALNDQDKRYHNELIQLPDGSWTHKWRVHIDGVHKDYRDDTGVRTLSDDTDTVEFAVPRDRFHKRGRIDYLITQAGRYASKEQRVRNWRSVKRECDFWEWTVYRVYSDGSCERVE